jgi:hypothetical protein
VSDLVAAIDAALAEVQARAIGEFIKLDDVDDLLLDLRSQAQKELLPA